MAGSTHAAVTPAGIRDGEPSALAALVERRANSVLAYCEAVLPRAEAEEAAAEAFARFRSAVATAADPRALDPETLLIGATRHAAAGLVVPAPAPSGGSGLRRLLPTGRGAPSAATCGQIPGLVAARAEGALGEADQERLKRHLERHPPCRALAASAARAERAYAAPPERTVPIGALTEILLALAAAAPVLVDPEDGFDFGVDPDELPPPVLAGRPLAPPEPADGASDADLDGDEPPLDGNDEDEDEEAERFEEDDEGDDPPRPAPAAASDAVGDPYADSGPGGQTAVLPAIPAAGVATGRGVAHPRPQRLPSGRPAAQHQHGVIYRYLLPGAFVAATLLLVMVVAGVFSADPETPGATTSSTIPSAPPPGAPPVGESSLSRRSAAEDAAVRRAATRARKLREKKAAAARRGSAGDSDEPPASTSSTSGSTPPASTSTSSTSGSTPPAVVLPAPRTQGTTTSSAPSTGAAAPAPKAPSTAQRQTESSSGLPGAGGKADPSDEPGVFKGTTP